MNKKIKKSNKNKIYTRNIFTPGGGLKLSDGIGMAAGAVGLVNTFQNNLEVPEIDKLNIDAKSKGDLLNRVSNFKGYDVGRTNLLGSTLSSALSGAQAGMLIGGPSAGIGAGVGAAIGGIGALVTGAIGNRKKEEAEQAANRQFLREASQANDDINRNTINDSLRNVAAYGGILPMTRNVNSQLALNGNNLFAYGGQFSNGITQFNNGGTHEENPLGGIPQGIGENGEPNLVEEDEVKWKNYIFSNRLKVGKDVKDHLLGLNLVGKSYAEAAKYLNKESNERELDPISRLGLNTNLSRLAGMQEQFKMQQENMQATQGNTFEGGGHLKGVDKKFQDFAEYLKTTKGIDISKYITSGVRKAGEAGNMGKDSPHVSRRGLDVSTDFDIELLKSPEIAQYMHRNGIWILDERDEATRKKTGATGPHFHFELSKSPSSTTKRDTQLLTGLDEDTMNNYAVYSGNTVSGKPYNKDYFTALNTKTDTPVVDTPPAAQSPAVTTSNELSPKDAAYLKLEQDKAAEQKRQFDLQQEQDKDRYTALAKELDTPNYMRYAPVASNLFQLADLYASSPDRVSMSRISPERATTRMEYKPIDTAYMTGQIGMQGNTLNRLLQETSGGNRAVAQAQMLNANRNTQESIGQAALQTNQYNQGLYDKVLSFNSQIEQFNLQNDMKAKEFNATRMDAETQYAKQADAAKRMAISQGWASIGTSIGDIAKEKRSERIAPLLYGYDTYGRKVSKDASVSALGGQFKIYKNKIK